MIEWEPTWRESGSGVYYNFSIIFLYLYSNFEGTTFRNVFVFGDCCRWGVASIFSITHGLYFREANGLAGKAKIYLFFFIRKCCKVYIINFGCLTCFL